MKKNISISTLRLQKEKESRRHSILMAAKQVFFEVGYVKATMDTIAKHAEITKPTVYQYFKGKDELFFSLMIPIIDLVKESLIEIKTGVIDNKIVSTEMLFDTIYNQLFHIYSEDPGTFEIIIIFQHQFRLIMELREERRSIIISKVKLFYTEFRELMEISIQKGLIKPVDLYQITDMIWISFTGIIQMKEYKTNAGQHIKDMMEFSKHVIINYLKV